MLCDDPLDRAFRNLGYNTLRYPSTRYTPLLLLESHTHRSVRAVGALSTELWSAATVPPVLSSQPAPDVGLTSTRRMSAKVGATIAQPILTALGVSGGVSSALESASGLTIVLKDVSRDGIELGDLAAYLEEDPQARSQHVAEQAAAGRLYVVTNVLRSPTLTIVIDRRSAAQLEATARVPQGVELSLEPQRDTSESRTVTFRGGAALTFAFQAVRLVSEGGAYMDYRTAHGLTGFELPSSRESATRDDGLLRLSEPLTDD